MAEIFLSPDLPIAAATNNIDANTASFSSPTVGSTRTAERLGDRLRFQIQFSPSSDNPLIKRQRGRLIAFLSSLRGQAGRVWMTPPGATLRGSFPATELFANNDFSSGTTSWGSDADYSLSALDRSIRSTRAQVTTAPDAISQGVTRTIGAPYAIRFFISAGLGSPVLQIKDFSVAPLGSTASQGMLEVAYASPLSVSQIGLVDAASPSALAGFYFDTKWASFSRCALVDNGVNLFLNSDTPGSGTGWSLNSATAGANGTTGPDGNADAWQITEAAATTFHAFTQAVTVSSSPLDYSVSFFVAPGFRPWCYLQMNESIGSTAVVAYFNVSTGAVGTITTGANWSNASATFRDYGNGWKRVILTARKTNASTGITALGGPATANGTNSYLGISGSGPALQLWRASFAQSSVPVTPVATTAAQQLGTLQAGLQLNLKGLPVSTQGLLLPGDWFECGSQLNQMAASLDSDSSGLGTAILTRPPRNSPADGTGFVVNTPMGKFMVTSNSTAWNENPGSISDASIEFAEDISF